MLWKGEKNPYKIWLSEIILQQTRVEQGEKYYEAILKKYPTVSSLARAKDEEMFKLWQGLGYYNRCKNLLFTARFIETEYAGIFPQKYEQILQLKGVGSYTAAAIASFAYNLPHAVVDGNVVRVLSRYFALDTDFYTTSGKKVFEKLANELIDINNAARYNQAIMDLGATVCKPQNPECGICPFQKTCKAKLNLKIADYPVKKTKLKLKEREFHFFLFSDKNHYYLTKRTEKDIWQNLYTPYLVEGSNVNFIKNNVSEMAIKPISETFQQILTHQKITGYFYEVPLKNEKQVSELSLQKIKKNELSKLAFPKMIISFFKKNNYL